LFANGCANQIDCVDEQSHCAGNDFECDFAYENESATVAHGILAILTLTFVSLCCAIFV